MIKILADSTCDLSDEFIKKYDISLLPLHILLDKKEYHDRIDITPDKIFKWAEKSGAVPKTSAPNISDAINMLEKLTKNNDNEIICFTISSHMSTSQNVIKLASIELDVTDRVHIIDSKNLSAGIGLLILETIDMIVNEFSTDKILNELEILIPKVNSSFIIDKLDFLYKGGRCNGMEALLGNMLRLHPKIVVEGGKMKVSSKYRGKIKKVFYDYLDDMSIEFKNARKKRIIVNRTGCSEDLFIELFEKVKAMNIFEEVIPNNAGSVISSHSGPNTFAVHFIEK